MEEWIKKSDAIEAINKSFDKETLLKCFVRKIAIDAIIQVPSADRPSGEWIDNGDRYFRCSLCGTKDTDRWCWCHGCGHPMKGADDEQI